MHHCMLKLSIFQSMHIHVHVYNNDILSSDRAGEILLTNDLIE
jgi:hypothetical protein